ncbi:MAG: DUF1599 domain-containing protein [Cyclobacteriaceae bacterium]
MATDTVKQFEKVVSACRSLFHSKTKDYGTAWRILRLPSITDQLFIKAQRIRSIQEKGTQKINEDISDEFIAIVNYCVIALMQLKLTANDSSELPVDEVMETYDHVIGQTKELLGNKNHDYDEAWRDLRISSMTDIILMKLLRVKQIEDNAGKTLVSEGIDANYQDMINYAIFCLIKLSE